MVIAQHAEFLFIEVVLDAYGIYQFVYFGFNSKLDKNNYRLQVSQHGTAMWI